MTSRELSREIALKVELLGVRGMLRLVPRKLAQQLRAFLRTAQRDEFDLKYGTDTGGVINVSSLDLPEQAMKHAVRYQTAISGVFVQIVAELPIRYQDYAFIDIGSGKGRALLLASALPFKSIIGVEVAPSLHRIACNNIRIYRPPVQQCHNIVSVCENAANYDVPSESAVFYLFNPFDAQVMQSLLLRLEASLRRFPRTVYILYLKPVHREVFDRSPLLKVLKATNQYVIYQSNSPLSS